MTTSEVMTSELNATEVAQREGFTTAEPRRPLRSRLWRARFWILCAVLFFAIIGIAVHTASPQSTEALSTRNPGPTGSMATAEILRDQGVHVREVSYLERARIGDSSETTLVITLPSTLLDYQLQSILGYPGDVVFLGASLDVTNALAQGLQPVNTRYATSTEEGARPASCDDPDALAAGRVSGGGPGIVWAQTIDASSCFADSTGAATYVVLLSNGHRIAVITDPVLAMNRSLTAEGNAALVFRALGHHANLVWYLSALDDTSVLMYPGSCAGRVPDSVPASPDFLPTGTGDAIYAFGLAGLVAAVWKGRRMGRLVTESLPVVVHASESTRGRARLYRRAHAHGRASAALRAAAAERMGRRLGVPRSADAFALVAAVAKASSRDAVGIERLLYGPPPQTEAAMMDLATELDSLEREVHRP